MSDAQGKMVALGMLFSLALGCQAIAAGADAQTPRHYAVDTDWPKLPLPGNWALGQVGGIFVDADDRVWVLQRPGTLLSWERAAADSPPRADCCVPAPPVIVFDKTGSVVKAWGGPGEGYDWPAVEHGITVDHEGNVWIAGSATSEGPDGRPADGMVLKFTADGEFLLQIGGSGPSRGSLDTGQLSGASDISVHAATNEVFVADGYGNHRVIVFDADTGEFKRYWGAYGEPPTDRNLPAYDPANPPSRQFRTLHCIKVANDGLVYACDRDNNRLQVFNLEGDFIDEFFYSRDTLVPGTVAHLSFLPEDGQQIMAVTDLANSRVRLVQRKDGAELSAFGHFGNYAGQLNRLHQAVFDSAGTIYTAEATGKRVQRWVPTGRK